MVAIKKAALAVLFFCFSSVRAMQEQDLLDVLGRASSYLNKRAQQQAQQKDGDKRDVFDVFFLSNKVNELVVIIHSIDREGPRRCGLFPAMVELPSVTAQFPASKEKALYLLRTSLRQIGEFRLCSGKPLPIFGDRMRVIARTVRDIEKMNGIARGSYEQQFMRAEIELELSRGVQEVRPRSVGRRRCVSRRRSKRRSLA